LPVIGGKVNGPTAFVYSVMNVDHIKIGTILRNGYTLYLSLNDQLSKVIFLYPYLV
jgi:hypothetical protein